MLDHFSLQCDDVEASLAFYLDVFAPIGIAEVMRYDGPTGPVVGLRNAGFPSLWLSAGEDSSNGANRLVHLAPTSPDRAAVAEVGLRAATLGPDVLHELRTSSEYHPAPFRASRRDTDGHRIKAVCHSPG